MPAHRAHGLPDRHAGDHVDDAAADFSRQATTAPETGERSMKMLAIAIATVLTTGCLSAVKGNHPVADADQAGVANCTFVDDVKGDSTFGSRTGVRVGISQAMQQARENAAKAGATHIVWQGITNPDVATVTGKAYRCGDAGAVAHQDHGGAG